MERTIFEKSNHIGILTLNKPPFNIFDGSFYREIKAAFEKINEMDDIFVVIINSMFKHFSGGGDLKEIQSVTEENAAYIMQAVADCMTAVYTCKKPTIAAVNGRAVGAGTAFAASCDIIIASENARFSLPEISVGFIGAAEFLELLIPRKAARYYTYTGKEIPKNKLLAWGGIHAVVPDGKLMDEAVKVAEELMESAPYALSCFKEVMNINDDEKLAEKYMRGCSYFIRNSMTEDFKECHHALKDKRKPLYKGD